MLTTHKAIDTRYKGYRFRSRLEARWAVFFDHCGIDWVYEPEGYDLSQYEDWFCGQRVGRYLPDFFLTSCGLWVEIKGSIPANHFLNTNEECQMVALCAHTDVPFGYVFYGLPDAPSMVSCISDNDVRRTDEGVAIFSTPWVDIEKAIHAAKSARFEYGESGAR